MKTTTLAVALLLSTACTTQTTHIYKPDGTKQCQPALTTLADSTTTLTNASIDVLSSNCATQTGMAVITVCGAPTWVSISTKSKPATYRKPSSSATNKPAP